MIAALGGADLLWLDALSNPGLDVPELDLILPAARRLGIATLVVDSTLATPVLLRPLELGADLVLHSATKYIGGHSDLILGAAVARDPRVAAAPARRRDRGRGRPGDDGGLARRCAACGRCRCGSSAARAAPALLAEPLARAHGCARACATRASTAIPRTTTAMRLLAGFGAVVSFELADAERADARLRGGRADHPRDAASAASRR